MLLKCRCGLEDCEADIKKRTGEAALNVEETADDGEGGEKLTGAAKSLCVPFEQPTLPNDAVPALSLSPSLLLLKRALSSSEMCWLRQQGYMLDALWSFVLVHSHAPHAVVDTVDTGPVATPQAPCAQDGLNWRA